VLDESGSMKQLQLDGSSTMEGLKDFAKFLVHNFALGLDAARFSVVSFQSVATTRVGWSTNQVDIDAAIDEMEANGGTSISAGFEAAGALFNESRAGATQVVLLFSDGRQEDEFGGSNASIASANLVKESGVTVFAWGMGKDVDKKVMTKIATDKSKALTVSDFVNQVSELSDYFAALEDAVCNVSPPPPPPSPAPPPPPCVDIGREGYPGGDEAFCANTDQGENGGVGTDELRVLRCKSDPWERDCQVTCGKCDPNPPSSPPPLR